MGRPPKIPNYLICFADQLACVTKERHEFVADASHDESLMEEIDWYPADGILIALRRCFSLTYTDDYSLKARRRMVASIRRIGAKALQAIPKVLTDLRLAPVPDSQEKPEARKAQIFKFTLVEVSQLPRKVICEGKKRDYLDLLGHEVANPLVVTLRSVVSQTFVEAFDDDQHEAIIKNIRTQIWQMLPAYNICLNAIEVEPIAEYRADEEDSSVETERS